MRDAPRLSYLICASPRSGSTLLAATLKETGLAGAPEELFRGGIRDEARDRQTVGADAEADVIPQLLVRSTTTNGIFGTKLHGFQTSVFMRRVRAMHGEPFASLHAALEHCLPGLRYTWITRDDTVKEAVSYYRALMSDVWHVPRQESWDVPARVREVRFDPVAIGACQAFAEANDLYWDGYFKTHGIEPLHIVYEELARDFESVMRRVFAFLDLPVGTPVPSPATEKLADAESAEWVARYRALAARQDYRPYSPAECARHWAPY